MTTILTRVRVDERGNVTIPVGPSEVGVEVDVVITPARSQLTDEEYRAIIKQTAGSIDDPTFERPPQWPVAEREPLD